MSSLLIKNIGKIVSGNIEKGILQGKDTIAVKNGLIFDIGQMADFDENEYETIVDVNRQVVIPGLIDTHVHNGAEDYSACLRTTGFLEEAVQNGTTTMISEGEQGPGYPLFYNDTEGIKAGCIFMNRVFRHFRPGKGLKLHAGALVLTNDLQEEDFAHLREQGIWRVAEIGGSGTGDMDRIKKLVKLARKHGFFISVHLSPPSIPGSTWLRAEDVLCLEPDKIAHVNGGTTSLPWSEIKKVIDNSCAALELIAEGNYRSYNRVLDYTKERGELERIVFGSDGPTGVCNLPRAINKAIVRAACLNDFSAEQVIAMATGNSARVYKLNTGEIEVGKEADLVVIDAPPGSIGKDALSSMEAGDHFGCSLVIVDGRIVAIRGRDTRATTRYCMINNREISPKNIHEFLYDPPNCVR